MKKTLKGVLCAVVVICLIFALTGCAKISYVVGGAITAIEEINDGSWKEEQQETIDANKPSEVVIEPFIAGTYGGTDFATQDDVVNYYIECYNNTKAQTASYVDKDGNTKEYYALLGDEKLIVDKILVEGTENKMLNNAVPGMVTAAFAYNSYGLPPCNNRNPLIDNTNQNETDPGEYDLRVTHFKPEYSLASNVTENADGTITIVIQPKDASMSARGGDSQGSFFSVLNDLGETVDNLFTDYDMLSWASGTTQENCVVDYRGGTGKVTIDPETKTIISADYHMSVFVEVKHANVAVIKDKSGSLFLSYDMHYPASDDYILKYNGITRK